MTETLSGNEQGPSRFSASRSESRPPEKEKIDKELPLHLKYRPSAFEEVVGNEIMVKSVQSTLSRKGVPHAFMFTGPTGCGKTTMARITAGQIGTGLELIEINGASARGIDTVRYLENEAMYRSGRIRVFLWDECHQMTVDAAHAFLKLLEEPPSHMYFMLCTTEPESVLKTIRNRCSTFEVKPLTAKESVSLLKSICDKEGIDIKPEALEEIARVSEGSPRRALVILDQVWGVGEDVLIETIRSHDNVEESETSRELCRSLMEGDWAAICYLRNRLKQDPERVQTAVLRYFERILSDPRSRCHAFAAKVIDAFSKPFFDREVGLTRACYEAFQSRDPA